MTLPEQLHSILQTLLAFLAEDPVLRSVQGGLIGTGFLLIFLIFFTTRDILQRTNSFFYMLVCILLVALVPVAGFFMYLLIRPARTLHQREVARLLESILSLEEKKNVSHSVSPKLARKKVSK